ncbi:MAG: hypothetical protein WBI07_19230 [Mobilitalea sp.]
MKINNMTDALKLILLAVAAFITCIVVFVSIRAMDTAREISGSAISQIASMNEDIKDGDLLKYDDTEVTGSDVVNCIRKYLGDYTAPATAPISVYVKTTSTEHTYNNSSYNTNIKNFTDTRYIKPTAVFAGDIIKNANNVIVSIVFKQQ